MNIDNSVYLALDTSCEVGAVVLFRGEEILYEEALGQKFAHGKLICQALRNAVSIHDELAGIMCGLGPGSFVGVRIALATALGFSFGRALPLMGFCSHDALAFTTNHAHDFSLFMKASGDLGYLTRYSSTNGILNTVFPASVVKSQDLPSHVHDQETVFTDYADRLSSIDLGNRRVERLVGPTPRAVAMAARTRLARTGGFVDEACFIKPNYVKAPSVSVPKSMQIAVQSN